MERQIISRLKEWKENPYRKPLLLVGARQVGKTFVLREFGRRNFENYIYLNCDGNRVLKEIFSRGYDIPSLLRNLSAHSGQAITKDTLLILDEIQEIPEALTSLKYLQEERPELFVAGSGSLLGLSLHEGTGFPVGKVEILTMYPMNFPEFVLATKGQVLYEMLMGAAAEDLEPFHEELQDLLRHFYFVGGMPEAVKSFAEGRTLEEIRLVQNGILFSYVRDISKHASPKEVQRIHQVWSSIPQQLAKENRRFIYGALKPGARAKDFELAIQWLLDAGYCTKVNRLRKATLPLKFYEDFNAFKLFFSDVGLLGAMAETPVGEAYVSSSLFQEYKGALTEEYVFTQLQSLLSARATSIFYYRPDESEQEVDFMFQKGGRVVPVEVKASENLKSKSLKLFCSEHPGNKGVRISMRKYHEEDWLLNLPLYLVHRILDLYPAD